VENLERRMKMKFKGDIIITDPCYLMKDKENNPNNPRPKMGDYPILAGKGSKKFSDFTEEENKAYAEYEKAQKKWDRENPDDWDVCGNGENLQALGFNTYLCRDTLYGDWSCTTYNADTKAVLGKFCADAGMVIVCLLDEVLKYNPDFSYHIKRPWTTTWIKDFDGDITLSEVDVHDDEGNDWEVRAIGKGNINFFTTQTGL
jgi:hypothetical protein